jgi:hypothetical protein
MRKIEEQMVAAVNERRNWSSGNTRVEVRDGGNWVKVYLHENLIYTECMESGEKRFTMAGWDTNTTRSRLNALGVYVSQVDFKQYYYGKEISPYGWYVVTK